jgi:hypothetical protein
MHEQKTIINKEGFVVEKNVLFEEGQLQYFELGEGQQAVEYLNKFQVVNGMNVEYLKPQYAEGEWIETATQEELNKAYPIEISEPNLEELNRADIDYIMMMQGL